MPWGSTYLEFARLFNLYLEKAEGNNSSPGKTYFYIIFPQLILKRVIADHSNNDKLMFLANYYRAGIIMSGIGNRLEVVANHSILVKLGENLGSSNFQEKISNRFPFLKKSLIGEFMLPKEISPEICVFLKMVKAIRSGGITPFNQQKEEKQKQILEIWNNFLQAKPQPLNQQPKANVSDWELLRSKFVVQGTLYWCGNGSHSSDSFILCCDPSNSKKKKLVY